MDGFHLPAPFFANPAYVLVHVSIINGIKLGEYGALLGPSISAVGGSMALPPTPMEYLTTKANGDSEDTFPFTSNATVERGAIIQFPNTVVATEWYASQAYREAISVRLEAVDAIFTLIAPASFPLDGGRALVWVVATVKNAEKFAEYAGKAGPLIAKHQGTVVVTPTDRVTLTDRQMPFIKSTGTEVVVVVEFPSIKKAESWYSDPDYQELISLREDAMDATMSIVEI